MATPISLHYLSQVWGRLGRSKRTDWLVGVFPFESQNVSLQGDVLVEMYRELYGRAAAFVNGVEEFR